MGRKFTLMILFLLSLGLVQAQNNLNQDANKGVVYSENFDTWPPEGWTFHKTEGNGFQVSEDVYMGAGAAYHKDDNVDNGCDSWMVSPAITVTDNNMLSFFQKNAYVGFAYELHGLCISTGSADPADGDFELIEECNVDLSAWTKFEKSLAAYAGQEIYIGFHYTGDYATSWFIDEFAVNEIEAYDVVMTSNWTSGIQFNGDFTPSVKVKQLGYENLVDLEVKLSVDGAEIETKTVTVDAFSELNVEFSTINITGPLTIKYEATVDGETIVVEKEYTKILDKEEAYARIISAWDENYTEGMITYNFGDVTSITNMPYGQSNDVTSFAGVMVNGLYFANMILSTSDDRGPYTIEKTRGTSPLCYAAIDLESGAYYNIAASSQVLLDMAYNPVDDKVYGLNNGAAGVELVSIDYRTGETSVIGVAGDEDPGIFTLAINLEGEAYGIDFEGNLYTINLTDFSSELVGATGFDPNYVQSIEFNHNDGELYWNFYSSPSAGVCIVDIETGEAEQIYQIDPKLEITGLGFNYGETKYYAGIKVVDTEGNIVSNASVTCDGMTRPTDANGIVTFIDLDLNGSYTCTVTKGDASSEATFTLDASKVVEVEIDIEVTPPPTPFEKAYSYVIWTADNQATYTNGPVTFTTETIGTFTELPNRSVDNMLTWAGTMVNNNWFVNMHIKGATQTDPSTPYYYSIIDKETGEPYAIMPTENLFGMMAYNYNDQLVYAIEYDQNGDKLYSINHKTGETTFIGATDISAELSAFAIDLEGNAYIVAEDKNLYSVNLTDFSGTLIGTTGVSAVKYIQTMAFDHNTETLYWNLSNDSDGSLYYIDVETGLATKLGDHAQAAQLTALAFDYDEAPVENYAAIKTVKDEGGIAEGTKVTYNGVERTVENYGIATFVGVPNGDQDFTTVATVDGETYTHIHTIEIDGSAKHDLVVDFVGLDEINNELSVYPNPSNGVVNIIGIENIERVQVVDMNGRVVLEENNNVLDLRNLAKGAYNLKIYTLNSMTNLRVILK